MKARDQNNVAALYQAIRDENLTPAERLECSKIAIDNIIGLEVAFKKLKQKNPELKMAYLDDYDNGTPPLEQALLYACEKNRSEVVMALLEKKVDPNKNDQTKMTPLSCASGYGRFDIVMTLLDKKADPNKANKKAETPLSAAIQAGHSAIVEALLEKGADPNKISEKINMSPLNQAVILGHSAIVNILLENNADPIKASGKDDSPLIIYASQAGCPEIVRALLEKNVNPNKPDDEYGTTALMCASAYGHISIATILLDAKADTEFLDNKGNSALDYALSKKNITMIALLLKQGAKINNYVKMSNFLSSQDQMDINILACLKMIYSPQKILKRIDDIEQQQLTLLISQQESAHLYTKKLNGLHKAHKAYKKICSFFLDEATINLPSVVLDLISSYEDRNPTLKSKIVFFQPAAVDSALREIKEDIFEKIKYSSHFNKLIQQIDKTLELKSDQRQSQNDKCLIM